MSVVLVVVVTAILSGCGTYKGNQMWRRSTCSQIVDVDERTQCLEEATRPESDYKRDVEDALQN